MDSQKGALEELQRVTLERAERLEVEVDEATVNDSGLLSRMDSNGDGKVSVSTFRSSFFNRVRNGSILQVSLF